MYKKQNKKKHKLVANFTIQESQLGGMALELTSQSSGMHLKDP